MRGGFTLAELLVVIAVIALLLAILLPSLRRARDQAKTIQCASTQRMLALQLQLYFTEQDGWIPGRNTTAPAIWVAARNAFNDPEAMNRGDLPVQTYDWMTPVLRNSMSLPARRVDRYRFLLKEYRCPAAKWTARLYVDRAIGEFQPSDHADFEADVAERGPFPAISYLMPANLQMWGRQDDDLPLVRHPRYTNETLRVQGNPSGIEVTGNPRTWEVRIERYRSRLEPAAPPRMFDAELPCDVALPVKAPHRDDWVVSAIDGEAETLLLHRPGGEPRSITGGPHRDRTPRWSPDGRTIAFSSDRSGRFEIWTVSPDGSDPTQLTRSPANARNPVWSPDGERIAYHVEGGGAWLVSRKTGDARPLGPGTSPPGFEPWSWSPEGIAGTAGGIVVVEPDRSRFTRLTDFGERPLRFRDGLIFSHEHAVYYRADRGEPRVVWPAGPNRVTSLDVHPDRDELVLGTRASREYLWLLDLEEDALRVE